MSLNNVLDTPLYTGTPNSGLVPGVFPCAIDGRPYMIDYDHDVNGFRGQFFHHRAIAPLRPSQDTGSTFGESSLNPEGLIRWSQFDWSHGAGQVYADRSYSDPFRFRSSKGVDCWTRGQLSLLNDVTAKRASANTNLFMVSVGGYLYLTDGNSLLYTQSVTAAGLASWTAVTGTPAAAPTSLATDGFNVWAAYRGSGLYATTRGAAAATQLVSTALSANTVVGFVKGRLMVAKDNAVYNVTNFAGPAALPTALFTHANTDFQFVGFAEGTGQIYFAGYSGDKSVIWRVAVRADGTSLDFPVVAGELPDGEIVRSIQGYLGFILLGTDKGVRFCTANAAGDLTLGQPNGATAAGVYCFEPQDRFVWFGWTNYDTSSSGLGRLDLQTRTDNPQQSVPVPAYASDLMATAQGQVQSVVTFQSLRVFAVSGVGVYAQNANLVADGTLDGGIVAYGLPDPKVPVFLEVRTLPNAGTHKAHLAVDGGVFTQIGTDAVVGTVKDTFYTPQSPAVTFEVRPELQPAASLLTGPTVTRQTLKVNPLPSTGTEIVVPVILHTLEDVRGRDVPVDVFVEYAALDEMRSSGRLVNYQEYDNSWTVTVVDLTLLPYHAKPLDRGYDALAVVVLHTLL